MRCKVERSRLSGTIRCPASKSYTHRAIFLASLAGRGSTVTNALRSADTDATLAACQSLGAKIEADGEALRFGGGQLRPAEIDAANSGTTIRIASAVAALVDGTSTLTGDESLQSRPMRPLLDALEALGARCSSNGGRPPVTVTGRIAGGHVDVPGNISSQFISALLIAAPLTRSGVALSVHGELVSRPYIDATVASMRRFGAGVHVVAPFREYVLPPLGYAPASFAVPSDASSAALLFAAAALAGEDMKIETARNGLPQGDDSFVKMLKELGARVTYDGSLVSIDASGGLGGGRFDLGDTPDLLPPLSILATQCSEPLEIANVGHARLKETDRVAVLARELAKVGIGVQEGPGSLTLMPTASMRGAHLEPRGDHRLFMALCILAMRVGSCTVGDPESARVSYPRFVSEMRRLGAVISAPA